MAQPGDLLRDGASVLDAPRDRASRARRTARSSSSLTKASPPVQAKAGGEGLDLSWEGTTPFAWVHGLIGRAGWLALGFIGRRARRNALV